MYTIMRFSDVVYLSKMTPKRLLYSVSNLTGRGLDRISRRSFERAIEQSKISEKAITSSEIAQRVIQSHL